MQMIERKNDNFNIAAFYKVENGEMINTYITVLVKKSIEVEGLLDIETEDIASGVKFVKVEAETVDELVAYLDQEEEELLNLFEKAANLLNQKHEGVEA